MKYFKGDRRVLLAEQIDGPGGEEETEGFERYIREDGERVTPAGFAVEVLDVYPEQESRYAVGCPETGGWWFFSEEEMDTLTGPLS